MTNSSDRPRRWAPKATTPKRCTSSTSRPRSWASSERSKRQLAKRVDVSLLSELLDRTARLDDSLRALYMLLALTEGVQAPEVEVALADVDAARQALPAEARALSVILFEIGLGGPHQAVIAIEQARGRLLDAIGALGEPRGARPGGRRGPSDTESLGRPAAALTLHSAAARARACGDSGCRPADPSSGGRS